MIAVNSRPRLTHSCIDFEELSRWQAILPFSKADGNKRTSKWIANTRLEWTSRLEAEGGSSTHVCAMLLAQSQNFILQGSHLFFTTFKTGQMLPFTKSNHSFGRPFNSVFLLRYLIAY